MEPQERCARRRSQRKCSGRCHPLHHDSKRHDHKQGCWKLGVDLTRENEQWKAEDCGSPCQSSIPPAETECTKEAIELIGQERRNEHHDEPSASQTT